MIDIQATTKRQFQFPAPVPQAIQFFSNFRRITQFLPHISLVKEFEDGRYRVLYSTMEMAAYEVHIFADVTTQVDEAAQTITVEMANGIKPVKSNATLRSLTAPGSYKSRSIFHGSDESQCEIEYVMELRARLPKPTALRFIPVELLKPIADNITYKRMDEMIDGFISKSIRVFPQWQKDGDR